MEFFMSLINDMPQMLALVLLLIILYLGDIVSTRTKAWIPSVFVCAVLFLLGYWTFFPVDIVARAGIPNVVAVMFMYLLIVNMGTLLSVKELLRQWKTILISLAGIIGIIIITIIIGCLFFDRNTIIVAIPPLVGGIVSAIIMAKGATDAGLDNLAVFAIIIYVMQGFIGYPLTSIMLKREGRKVLQKYHAGTWSSKEDAKASLESKEEVTTDENPMPHLFASIPARYNSSYFIFLRIATVGFLAYFCSEVLKPIVSVSPFVLCLLFGVIASSFGFLERHPLKKAGGFGLAVMGLMLFIFNTLSKATPQMLIDLITPLVVFILAAVVGMFIFSIIVGWALKVSKEMAFSIALTALYGFPADYIITNEVINNLTNDQTEKDILTSHMLPPMLIGGFISVTIVSVVLAGVMVNMIVGPLTPIN
jgi:Na+/glutamate symporter